MQSIKSILSRLLILNKNILIEGFWPLVSNFTIIILNILTIKIITNFVSSDNYGKANLTIGILLLLNSLIIGPLMVAHNRLYFNYINKSKVKWYKKYFKTIIIKGIIIVLSLYLFIALFYYINGNKLYITYFTPLILLGIVTPFFSEKTDYIEAHRQQKKLAFINNFQKLLYPLLVFLLISFSLNQITSFILAQSLSFLIVILFVRESKESLELQRAEKLDGYNQKEEIKELYKEILSFGWYLPLGNFLMWLLTTSDRYFLDHFRSAHEVGIYALNYGLWSMPFLILNGWLEVWTRPHIYDKASKNEWTKLKNIIIKRLMLGSFLGFVIIIIIFISANIISHLLLSHDYIIDNKIIVLIIIAHFFQMVGYSILPIYISGKNLKNNFIALLFAASFNFVFNLVLIPEYGLYGAAFSTLIGYIIWSTILAIGLFNFKNKLYIQKNKYS